MHIGNLRTAIFEYLLAKSGGGDFILRIEDTDQARLVPGSVDVILKSLALAGVTYDEGPYYQSERRGIYAEYAKRLVETGGAYYCFCEPKERGGYEKYDGACSRVPRAEAESRLRAGEPWVIRQRIPPGRTSFADAVFGGITVDNAELDDQVLIKRDGMPTYNFANVVDDHLMGITHVVRGSEYLSSTPKYSLLYAALGWEPPVYVHLPLVLNADGEKLSKRRGDASFEDLVAMGYLPRAIVNFVALLGWSPGDDREFFTLSELAGAFSIKGLSKSPSVFDMNKLTWMNGEYFKRMDPEEFFGMALPSLKESVARPADLRKIAEMCRTRINFISDIPALVDFIDALPDYDASLYTHKKSKTDAAVSRSSLLAAREALAGAEPFDNDTVYRLLTELAAVMGRKNSQLLWPARTALSGKPTSPCGASELCELLGKDETLARIDIGISKLSE
jgi:glutamyl-tRNA synthetase